jgi:hypothetical protein
MVHDVLLDLRRWMHHDLWYVRNHSLMNTVTLQKTWILSHNIIRTSCLAVRVFFP